jgi:hypothetical protein
MLSFNNEISPAHERSNFMNFKLTMVAIGLLAIPSLAFSQTSGLTTMVSSFATNNDGGGFDFVDTLGFNFSPTGGFVSQSGSGSFDGLNSDGDFGTMHFSGSSTASVNFGRLRTQASGTVLNNFYNSDNQLYVEADGTINPDGTPDRFVTFSQAQFFDRFRYNGSSVNANVKVNFLYQVSGILEGDSAFLSLLVENDLVSDLFFRQSDGGTTVVNELWATKKFAIGADLQINHFATLVSQFDNLSTDFWTEGETVSGFAAFQNTVTLVGMNLFDEDDNLLDNWTFESDSGSNYFAIPEPATPLTLLGLFGLTMFRARQRKNI